MSNSKRSRRHFTTEQKVTLLKRDLVDKVPVSDLCKGEELQPRVFYQWQRQLFESFAAAFTTPASEGPSKREKELEAKTKELEAKLVKKDHVIAEVAADLVATKKELGEPCAAAGFPKTSAI